MAKISMDKKYKTADGRAVRILCVDRTHPGFPVHALVTRDWDTGLEVPVSYTAEGKYWDDGSTNCDDLVEISEFEDFKIDDQVMVRDSEHADWLPSYFAGVTEAGQPQTWSYGATSWTATSVSEKYRKVSWNFCRKPTAEELENKSN